ncbi:MAG: alpha/beta hydrolase [Thermodesulfobacteriota bacterium]|nr:alpha/beta hydrolase [Thermodesulfobacteriota bacterium]
MNHKNHLIITGLVFFVLIFSGCASNKVYTTQQVSQGTLKGLKDHSHFVEVDSQRMHYIDIGEGEPMILIHGWFCSGSYWKREFPLLKGQYHIYAPDMIGHGISYKPASHEPRLTTANQAKWIIGFMDALGIDKAYIVGHSMGGEVASRVAIMAPQRVKKLVLIDAVGLRNNPSDLPWYIRAGRKLHLEAPASGMMNRTTLKMGVSMFMYYKENKVDKEFIDDIILTTAGSKKDRACLLKVTREGLFQSFVDEDLKALDTPTRCIWGRYDKVVPLKLGKEFDRLIPVSDLVVIDNAAHMVPWERPKEISMAISDFCVD